MKTKRSLPEALRTGFILLVLFGSYALASTMDYHAAQPDPEVEAEWNAEGGIR